MKKTDPKKSPVKVSGAKKTTRKAGFAPTGKGGVATYSDKNKAFKEAYELKTKGGKPSYEIQNKRRTASGGKPTTYKK